MAAFVLVEVGSEPYALPTLEVEQVLRMVALSPLPGAPAAVEGLLNVRGELLPVISVHRWRGLPALEPKADQHLVVVRAAGRRAALHVDRVLGQELVGGESITGAEGWAPAGVPFSAALKLERGLVPVADLPRMLASVFEDKSGPTAPGLQSGFQPGLQ